ncbi:bifunctional 4-hydroxy-2-oxoglutarate aldolase/2-dehydro-3-deoxy-phosphogluconate aldolase [Aliifodinibius salicampi]|uniref:2-dehydro-3-deoxy-phosphogluconate aldolase n=1 Tax=Fodinibius salicampi TaxID=1920655 RepID=A0ABT3PVK2_9BACT|nr:bifunctional 4-hydroxy-2-oxoglutarate aldolase/2-dehydro-3-deoxy-phosphogluconate aldolase [Fodinibius salicampi]MCW9711872.1 bifunctional 4-hydroxy-2-oxoglutarate aldolase/2-dehydro-3-deoxy-phosphogluconate aldolase [Fodinibius salicampi]
MTQKNLQSKLLPAVTLSDADSALKIAEALLKGGLNVMEVTFRTEATAPAISAIVQEFPEMQIGAGTILSPDQLAVARDAGAQFGLSPGFSNPVTKKAKELDFPFIPGVMTPTDIETALNAGYKTLKLFPASDMGGINYINSLAGPYQHTGIRFLTMGGINETNLDSYLKHEMVISAGGSWLCPTDLIQQKKFDEITAVARKSVKLANNI